MQDVRWAKPASAQGPPFLCTARGGEHKAFEQQDAESAEESPDSFAFAILCGLCDLLLRF
jgi:hypothetical protein